MLLKDVKHLPLTEGDVIKGNFGKKEEPKAAPEKISVLQAFGSEEMNVLHDAGIDFVEKPSYFEDLESSEGHNKYKPITQIIFKKVQKELAKKGFTLAVLTAKEVYGSDPSGPLKSYLKKPTEQCYVIEFANGKKYLCDRTGANTYTRMWALIK